MFDVLFKLARFVGLPLLLFATIVKRIVLSIPEIAEMNKLLGRPGTFKLDIAILILFVLLVISIVMFVKDLLSK